MAARSTAVRNSPVTPVANKKLTAGTISPRSATPQPIQSPATFANLADDSTFTASNNTYQADYPGGDGNDLTLTVVP